jgi:predicted PurR-regulated permease PerM
MAIPRKRLSSAESLASVSSIVLTTAVIAVLYFGRELLVLLALAALLTFLFAPLVKRLERWLGKIGAVLFVVSSMFAVTISAGWIITQQAMDVAGKFPDYKGNIQAKLRSVQDSGGKITSMISGALQSLDVKTPVPAPRASKQAGSLPANPPDQKPIPVEVVNGAGETFQMARSVLASLLAPFGTAALVCLLLIFMLLQRRDLRDRMIRLVGEGHIHETTNALDDAGQRISKYLVMLVVVNATYGIVLAIALSWLGLPNAVLWGALAAVLRFLPYVGPWIAAAFPIVLSLASSPSWMTPVLTIAVFLILELASNNIMEPWLYGNSTGVTPFALVVAALVWTSLWGPVGLLLSTPLTVCLVVMGRHIPRLSFLSILLSDEAPTTLADECYQRLLIPREHDEMEFVDKYLGDNPLTALFDQILIPVVISAEIDFRSGALDRDQHERILQGTTRILEELEDRLAIDPENGDILNRSFAICCVPTRSARDQLPSIMLRILMADHGIHVMTPPPEASSKDILEWLTARTPDIICLSCLPPASHQHGRGLSAKLHAALPSCEIVFGLWGRSAIPSEASTSLKKTGVKRIVGSFSALLESSQLESTQSEHV